jgi:hypothetical protein
MLAVITPGSLGSFFLEAGEPATDASSPPPVPDIEKVMAAAAKYGVEIPPPPGSSLAYEKFGERPAGELRRTHLPSNWVKALPLAPR